MDDILDSSFTDVFDSGSGGDSYGGIPVDVTSPAVPSFGTGVSTVGTSPGNIFPDSGSTFVDIQDTSGDPSGSSSSGWLSGLSDVFAGIGAGVGAGIAASNLPKVPTAGSGFVWNPTTGTYFNPQTGQSLTATGTLPSLGSLGAGLTGNTGIILVILAIVAFVMLRKRE
jgi:hypothetical protein